MNFIMSSKKLEMRRVQVLDSDRFKTDHTAVFAVLTLKTKMRYTIKSDANLRGWKPDDFWQSGCRDADRLGKLACEGASVQGNSKSTQKTGNQGDDCDRARAEISPVEQEESRAAPRASRVELALSNNLEKEESVETRQTLDQDQGKCRDGKAPEKTQSKHFNWSSIAKQEKPETVLTNFFQDVYSIPVDQEGITQSERLHWIDLWKNLRVDWWDADLNEETGQSTAQTEKRERFTGSDHSGCFESIAPGMSGEAGEIVVDDVLEYVFPG